MIVHTLAGPCWSLSHERDHEDGCSHYGNAQEAQDALDAVRREARRDAEFGATGERIDETVRWEDWAWARDSRVEQGSVTCVKLACDECGIGLHYLGDRDADAAQHLNPAEIAEWVEMCSWTTDGVGHHHCGGCTILTDVTDCDHEDDVHPYCAACHPERAAAPASAEPPLGYPAATAPVHRSPQYAEDIHEELAQVIVFPGARR